MGLKVTAAQAAQLVGHHERLIRWHIARGTLAAVKDGRRAWAIDVSDLEAVPGWRVNRDRLADLEASDARSAATLAARVATLERDVQALRARLRMLEAGGTGTLAPVARGEGQEGLSSLAGVSSSAYRPSGEPVARPYSMTYTAPAAAGTFKTRSDAGRWLVRHGISSESTPKSWPGWREVELEPQAVLQLALALYEPGNWRITWRLHRCEDSGCVCRELLDAGAEG